jgi:phosphatidylglycerol:prolipoprotein diacylglycerol transferase
MNTNGAEIWFVNIGIKIQELNRVAINIFGFKIYWYGLIIGCGILLGLFASIREARRTGQDTDVYTDYIFIGIIVCIICARIYYVIFAWDKFKDNPISIFALRDGGIAIYGAVIGAVISAVVYTRAKNISFFKFADTAVIGLILGQAIGRWGNFFNKEAYGSFTDNLFAMAIRLDVASNPKKELIDNAVIIDGVKYIQVHPTFLYESIWDFCVFIFLNVYARKLKKFDGEIFAMYFLCYGVGRFFIEGLRTDQLKLFATELAVSQLLSLVFVIGAIIFIGYKRLKIRCTFQREKY